MNSYDLAEIWVRCKDKLKESFNEKVFNVWIKPIMPLEVTDTYYKVAVKNDFFKTMLEENYAQVIEGVLAGIMSKNIKLIIETMDNGSSGSEAAEEMPAVPAKREQQQLFNENTSVQQPDESNLNPKYVFETFVIGNSNRFAHAAAQAVANDPAHAYNPLFLYGGVGLGKTHLMHAIGNRIKQNNPSMKVLYTSSEKFTNEIINSIQNKTTEAFRQKYRNIDCLIIDDIQFLKGKEQTQVEFFHTFNALHQANKQIIISSDKSPDDLKKIEERLRSRFMWGLPVDIYPPDFNLRCDIIRSKVKNTSIENKLNDDVIEYIANSCVNDVRHIEGTINRLLAYTAMMVPDKITLDFANEALNDYVNTNIFINNSIGSIQNAVAEYFKISVDDLKSKRRTNTVVKPRHIAMYLCRVETDENLQKIGLEFGGRDHSTVSTACDKIKEELETNPNLNNMLKEIKSKLQ